MGVIVRVYVIDSYFRRTPADPLVTWEFLFFSF
jgi:hypothetical protein